MIDKKYKKVILKQITKLLDEECVYATWTNKLTPPEYSQEPISRGTILIIETGTHEVDAIKLLKEENII